MCGLISACSAICARHLAKKVSKHKKTVTLATSKQNTASGHVSTALNDGKISDLEFGFVLRKLEKYHALKADLRCGGLSSEKMPRKNGSEWEQIKKELRKEVRKKLGSMVFE